VIDALMPVSHPFERLVELGFIRENHACWQYTVADMR
jgi:hypothetical protein